jgi:hypothetical protein
MFHFAGVHFSNGYESEGLAHTLEFVMQHQESFALPPNLGRQGLLQIPSPSVEERAAAAAVINQAIERLTSRLEETVVA